MLQSRRTGPLVSDWWDLPIELVGYCFHWVAVAKAGCKNGLRKRVAKVVCKKWLAKTAVKAARSIFRDAALKLF